MFENLYQIFDDKWFSWTFLLASLGAALTCVIAGIFRSRYGTKFAIVIFSLPNVIGWLLLILVENVVAVSRKFTVQSKNGYRIFFLFRSSLVDYSSHYQVARIALSYQFISEKLPRGKFVECY